MAATYWEGDEGYDPTASQWYQQAIEAGGEIVYTDAYIDVRLQKPVFTIAKQVRGTQDVVAMDIYSDQLVVSGIREELPEEGHYYLCDSQGQLLYYVAHDEASPRGDSGADQPAVQRDSGRGAHVLSVLHPGH